MNVMWIKFFGLNRGLFPFDSNLISTVECKRFSILSNGHDHLVLPESHASPFDQQVVLAIDGEFDFTLDENDSSPIDSGEWL